MGQRTTRPPANLAGDPLAQELLKLCFEIVFRGVGIEGRFEMAFFGQEPLLEEGFQTLPVLLDFRPIGVFHGHRWRRGHKSENKDVGKVCPLPSRFDGGENLIGGPARIGPAVSQLFIEVGWQLGSQPPFQYPDDEITLGGWWDLRLECPVRLIKLGLPPDRFEAGDADKFAVEATYDILHPSALEHYVAG
jgi:hypothetical protein